MIDTRTRKLMERSVTKAALLAQRMIFAVAVGMLLLGLGKVLLAARWAGLDAVGLSALMQQWLSGPPLSGSYSGFIVRALGDLDSFILYFVFAVMLATVGLILRAQRKQNQQLIAELQQHGAW